MILSTKLITELWSHSNDSLTKHNTAENMRLLQNFKTFHSLDVSKQYHFRRSCLWWWWLYVRRWRWGHRRRWQNNMTIVCSICTMRWFLMHYSNPMHKTGLIQIIIIMMIIIIIISIKTSKYGIVFWTSLGDLAQKPDFLSRSPQYSLNSLSRYALRENSRRCCEIKGW